MHHYKQSRKQIAIRFFTYGVLTVAVLVLSGIGILTVLGYQFDFDSNSLQQTALVQFASAPSGATVTIDAKKLSGTTQTSSNVIGGSHTAVVSLKGYRDWSGTFNVSGGTVLWLNYALLIPVSPATHDFGDLGTTASDQTSPDKKWRLVTLEGKPTVTTLVDLTNPQQPVISSASVLPDALTKSDDGSYGTLAATSWDSGSRYAILKHTYVQNGAEGTEYLRYDRQNPSDVVNISQKLGVSGIAKIGFADASGNAFYALAGTDIRKLDLGAGTISGPLVSGVTQMYYNDGGETIAYARVDNGVTSIGVYRDAGGLVTTETYASTPNNLLVSYGEYYGYRYLATYHDGKVSVIQSPDTRQPTVTKTIPLANAQWLYFSPNGRILIAQTGNTFMTYDLETGHVYNQTLGNTTDAGKFEWLDDFHLVSDAGGTVSLSDFNGTNKVDLGPAVAGTGSELSNNAQWLFTISTVNGKSVLRQTALRVQ